MLSLRRILQNKTILRELLVSRTEHLCNLRMLPSSEAFVRGGECRLPGKPALYLTLEMVCVFAATGLAALLKLYDVS